MYASASTRVRGSSLRSSAALTPALLFAALAAACGGGSGGGGQSGIPGTEGTKEDGSFFIVDENQSGGGANVHMAEVLWGRLVDVHQIGASGERVDPALFPDFVIHPSIATDGTRYVLDRNPVTQKERLTILNVHGPDAQDPVPDEDLFFTLLKGASEPLPQVVAKNDDGSSAPPFTTVPRNACMVLRIDDCLDGDLNDDGLLDDDDNQALADLVLVFTGYPPTTPYAGRVVFDPNHGAKVGSRFHSTRVLVDMATAEAESSPAFPANAVGLPASQTSSSSTNASVRVPTQVDVGSGQPRVLTNLSGVALDSDNNGPIDVNSFTLDVVRAVKSGNPEDPLESNGFLRDLERPRVIGGWPITVNGAGDDGAGDPGFDFILNLTFDTICLNAPAVGDVVTVGENFAQVTEAASLSGSNVLGLKVRTVFAQGDASELLGTGLFQAPFHPSLVLASGCWVSFLPGALTFPTTGVETTAQILARFSEPMDPDTLSPFGGQGVEVGEAGGFRVVKGTAGPASTAIATNTIVGEVLLADPDLTAFSFVPSLPMPHLTGTSETYHVELAEARDLAGNRLRHQIPFVDFTIASLEPSAQNSSIVLRFEGADEYAPDTADADPFGDAPDALPDLRGQFFYDQEGGRLLPRPVAFAGWPVDQNNPVPMLMTPFPGGVFPPLSPLGCKLQTLWRYCDVGWDVRDETKYNLDVVGLNWSPFAGVLSDFYDQFEIHLGHSRFLPDEGIVVGAISVTSGLPTTPFDDNYLAGSNPDPLASGGVVVHNRALGYNINPAERFTATTGTIMVPYPLNRGGGTDVTYTWRDTAILARGADGDPNQVGIPLEVEAMAGLVDQSEMGDLGGPGNVPSFGLPLLIEIRCHPSDQGLGFNQFGITIGNALGGPPFVPVPTFRAYSAGGINTLGNPEVVLPDAEPSPRGGFNPFGTPPGVRTVFSADSIFYLGQLDTVVRVSRIHTVWLDAGTAIFPSWRAPLLEPPLSSQPAGTQILLDYRSATGFSAAGNQPFDSSRLDAFGNQIIPGDPQPQSLSDWSRDITIGNNRRFLQVRLTFVNNIATGVGAELGALALRYDIQ